MKPHHAVIHHLAELSGLLTFFKERDCQLAEMVLDVAGVQTGHNEGLDAALVVVKFAKHDVVFDSVRAQSLCSTLAATRGWRPCPNQLPCLRVAYLPATSAGSLACSSGSRSDRPTAMRVALP